LKKGPRKERGNKIPDPLKIEHLGKREDLEEMGSKGQKEGSTLKKKRVEDLGGG